MEPKARKNIYARIKMQMRVRILLLNSAEQNYSIAIDCNLSSQIIIIDDVKGASVRVK